MTARDMAGCVAAYCGHEGLGDDELDFLLWEQTSFPFGDLDRWVAQLEAALSGAVFDYFDRPNGPDGDTR